MLAILTQYITYPWFKCSYNGLTYITLWLENITDGIYVYFVICSNIANVLSSKQSSVKISCLTIIIVQFTLFCWFWDCWSIWELARQQNAKSGIDTFSYIKHELFWMYTEITSVVGATYTNPSRSWNTSFVLPKEAFYYNFPVLVVDSCYLFHGPRLNNDWTWSEMWVVYVLWHRKM